MTLFSVAASAAADFEAEWIGRGLAEWANAANWSPAIVPTNSATEHFHVTIPPPVDSDYHQINAPDNVEISGLTLLGSVIWQSAAANFRIEESFRWLGGSIHGGTLTLNGTAAFEGNSYKHLSGVILMMNGNASWVEGHLNWQGYGRVEINPGAVFQIEAGGMLGTEENTSSVEVFNRGTIRVAAPGKQPRIASVLQNDGLLAIQSGVFETRWGFGGTGAVNVASSGTFLVTGPATWQGQSISNEGEIIFSGREQNVAASTFFPGKVRIATTFGGDGELTLLNADWEAGDMNGAGLTKIPTQGRLNVRNGVTLNRVLRNEGIISLAPGALIYGYNGLGHTNTPSGVVKIHTGVHLGDPHAIAANFINHGLVEKDDDAGGATVSMRFHNHGLTRIKRGALVVRGGSDSFNAPAESSGTFEVARGARIHISDMNFTSTARLDGDGEISLAGGVFAGSAGTNVDLSVLNVDLTPAVPLEVRRLTVGLFNGLTPDFTATAREELILSGVLDHGQFRSLARTELSANVRFRNQAALDLGGVTLWSAGELEAQDTNVIRTAGEVRILGSADLILRRNSVLSNAASWTALRDIESFALIVSPQFSRITTRAAAIRQFPEAGPLHISGSVNLSTGRLEALAGSSLLVSEFTATNSVLELQGRFAVSNHLQTVDATVNLAGGTIDVPTAGWTGSAAFNGTGAINGSLKLIDLKLQAAAQPNVITVDGDLEIPAAHGSLAITFPDATNTIPPRIVVSGTVLLRGEFNLAGILQTNYGTNLLIESARAIEGAFANVGSGGVVPSTNLSGHRVYYGHGSPFGTNKLVLVAIGTPFDQWRSERFVAGQVQDPSISGASADPDGNGLSNIAEFIMGAGRETVPLKDLISIEQTLDGYTLIRITKRHGPAGVRARIAVSENLRDWSQTVLGESSAALPLHRAFELDSRDQFVYRHPRSPGRLFLRVITEAE